MVVDKIGNIAKSCNGESYGNISKQKHVFKKKQHAWTAGENKGPGNNTIRGWGRLGVIDSLEEERAPWRNHKAASNSCQHDCSTLNLTSCVQAAVFFIPLSALFTLQPLQFVFTSLPDGCFLVPLFSLQIPPWMPVFKPVWMRKCS